ncbi:MAG: hypothetical protein FWE72_05190 [Spirochaetaceae bacterium]|nr:hypothetical protein [Spirochaetaceae bacterium]
MNIKRVKFFIIFLIFFLVILPLGYVGIYFVGKISPNSVIPDYFIAYTYIPNPISMAEKLLAHEPFSDIILKPHFSSYLPLISKIKNNNTLDKKWARFVGKGHIEGALLSDGKFLAVWDIGIAAPIIRFFPCIVEKFSIQNLQRGKKSKFEYIVSDDNVIFIQPYKNLLIISNNLSVLDGTCNDADRKGSGKRVSLADDFDAGFLVASESVISWLSDSSPAASAFLKYLRFSDFAEIGLSIIENKIDISIISHIASDNADINKLISRDSRIPALIQHLPSTIQYSTVVSIGSFEELLNASLAVYAQKMPVNLKQIDRASRIFLGTGLNDLLFSWTGTEIAVLRVTEKDHPVYVLQVTDEKKRKEVFDKFSSANKYVPPVKGSAPVPQINLPGFLNMIFNIWNIKISAPYYIVQNEFLFLSEYPETLFSAIDSIRKDDLLLKTKLWKSLSTLGDDTVSDESLLMIFYSLDHASADHPISIFIKEDNDFSDVLKLYKHGLVRANIDNEILVLKLAVVQ